MKPRDGCVRIRMRVVRIRSAGPAILVVRQECNAHVLGHFTVGDGSGFGESDVAERGGDMCSFGLNGTLGWARDSEEAVNAGE